MNEIIFKYNHEPKNKPKKIIKVNYYKLINVLGYNNKKDRFGISYTKANTPQIIDILNILTSIKEIYKCNVFINYEIIL